MYTDKLDWMKPGRSESESQSSSIYNIDWILDVGNRQNTSNQIEYLVLIKFDSAFS